MNFITTCTVLLVVFVIHSAYGFDVVLKDKDCPGNDVNTKNLTLSLMVCMGVCNEKPSCIGIVHDVNNTCWIKFNCDKRQNSPGGSIYLKPTVGFLFKKDFTCRGNDVVIFREKMSITECMIQCNKNRACIGVTYNRGACLGKSKCLDPRSSRRMNTFFRPERSIGVTENFNCPGNDIIENGMQIPNPLCLELCGNIRRCVGIVYHGSTCWLKFQCTKGLVEINSKIYFLARGFSNTCPLNCGCDHNCLVENRKLECSCDEGFALAANDRRSCIECYKKLDVVFLLDGSGSVSTEFSKEQQFVKDMIDSFIIGKNHVQVGLVMFSTEATHEFFLTSHDNKTIMKEHVDSIINPGSSTFMHKGLEFVAAQFNATNGERFKVPNVVIALTDGILHDGPAAEFRAQELKDAGVVIYSVGIGNVNEAEIKAISSQPQELHSNYFITRDFKGLVEEVKHSLLEKVCTETKKLYYRKYFHNCGCQHNCIEINGTMACSCYEGFALADNRKNCTGCLKSFNLVFLMDSSNRTDDDAWKKQKLFVSKIVESVFIHDKHVNVGLVGFANIADHFFFLNSHQNKTELLTAISQVESFGSGEGTDLTKGLELVQAQFSSTNSGRKNLSRILIVLTDGVLNNPTDANAQAQALKDDGITIYSVGVRNRNATEIKALSSPPQKEHENFFITTDFSALVEEVKHVLLRNICQD